MQSLDRRSVTRALAGAGCVAAGEEAGELTVPPPATRMCSATSSLAEPAAYRSRG